MSDSNEYDLKCRDCGRLVTSTYYERLSDDRCPCGGRWRKVAERNLAWVTPD